MSEKIIGSAIQYNGQIFSVLAPGRHSDCIAIVHNVFGEDRIGVEEQGFITSENRYVDRYQAKEIASRNGQMLPRASPLPELFSEDVW